MSNYSNPRYPYNINPQYKDFNPGGPSPCLSCPPDESLQAIVFDCNKLSVVKGWETKTTTSLEEFFVPCTNYLEYELTIKPSTENSSITLHYGNIADESGGVQFLMILPLYYQNSFEPDQCKINYKYTTDSSWTEFGKIMMLSGTKNKSIRPIELQNISDENIVCRILIAGN